MDLARGAYRDSVIEDLEHDRPPAALIKLGGDRRSPVVRVVEETRLTDILRDRDVSPRDLFVVVCGSCDDTVWGALDTAGMLPRLGGLILKNDVNDSVRLAIEAASRGALWVLRRLWRKAFATSRTPSGRGSLDNQLGHLTPAERETLRLVADGMTDIQIAVARTVSVATVRHHMRNLRHKTGCTNRTKLVALAYQSGLCGGPIVDSRPEAC